jgi:shikimate dehydrogenase
VSPLYDAPVVGPVVVSTIPATGQTDDLVARCAEAAVLFDVVYHPWPTPLAASVLTGRADRVLVSGLDLLVHQAALQFELFTGLPADTTLLAAMRAALP